MTHVSRSSTLSSCLPLAAALLLKAFCAQLAVLSRLLRADTALMPFPALPSAPSAQNMIMQFASNWIW